MRAAVLRDGRMHVRDDVPDPVPASGQVLVEVAACGICGSDLHFAKHGRTMIALGTEMEGMPSVGTGDIDIDADVFMGHEFSARVLEVGPDTQAPAGGTLVTSIPILFSSKGIEPIVYSNSTVGGYGEQMLLSAPLLVEVPNGLDFRHAALTEPMAVGLHAVNRADIGKGHGALVLGSGPVGLAVIAALKVKGIEPIVATDLSPTRRALALTMGAHEVIDPRDEAPFEVWSRVGASKGKALVAFDAIGVPGIIESVLKSAPPRTRLVVVGVCMERDVVTPFFACSKELDLRFSMGYDPMEFTGTLRSIAEGEIDVAPMITAEVGLDGVDEAFEALSRPDEHCKILVVP